VLGKKIQGLGMKVYETKITMKNKIAEDALANFILKQVHV
jgi:LPPG:FO 2-phospho-L-lactate transferase